MQALWPVGLHPEVYQARGLDFRQTKSLASNQETFRQIWGEPKFFANCMSQPGVEPTISGVTGRPRPTRLEVRSWHGSPFVDVIPLGDIHPNLFPAEFSGDGGRDEIDGSLLRCHARAVATSSGSACTMGGWRGQFARALGLCGA